MKKCPICATEHSRRGTGYCSTKCRIVGNTNKKDNGCWEWQGGKSGDGYGAIKDPGNRRQFSTHRRSYEEFKGEIPKGMLVCHSCDNILCCNPDHLFLGTAKENTLDSVKKARWAKRFFDQDGSKNHMSKLSEKEVLNIKMMLRDGVKMVEISKKFNINAKTLQNIKSDVNWRHVLLE